jgi:hypothetical protein
MMGRNRRGYRQASMKARLAIASAVLAGGAAIGAVAVAASSHPTPSAATSAGYTLNFRHPVSEATALSTALSDWATSHQKSFSVLSQMQPMRSFSTARHGRTEFAVQRGVVALATKHWLLVKSANGSLHLWLLNGKTQVTNVGNSTAGTAAMTGSTVATTAAMQQGNMAPAAQVMAGSTATVNALNNPAPKPATFTVSIAGSSETITITITPSTATVAPTTTQVAQQVTQQTGIAMTKTTQPTFAATKHVARGDLVLVAGVVKHGYLWAQLVLFSAPGTTVTPTPTPSVPTVTPTPVTSTTAPTTTVTPTTTPTITITGTPAVSSTHY